MQPFPYLSPSSLHSFPFRHPDPPRRYGGERALRLLLAASPAAALTPSGCGMYPLHCAAARANVAAVRLLLAAAPAAASTRGGPESHLPLEMALARLDQAEKGRPAEVARYLQVARMLLPATPLDDALSAVVEAGDAAFPLLSELSVRAALPHCKQS